MIKYLARYTTATAVQQLMWQDDDTAVQSSDHMIQVSNQPASLLLSAVRTPSLATSWSCIAARQKCLDASPAGSQTLSLSAWHINDHVGHNQPRVIQLRENRPRIAHSLVVWGSSCTFQALPQLQFLRVSNRMGNPCNQRSLSPLQLHQLCIGGSSRVQFEAVQAYVIRCPEDA